MARLPSVPPASQPGSPSGSPSRAGDGEPPRDEDPAGPWITRFGTVVGAGALAAILGSVPALLRLGSESSAGLLLQSWLMLAAVLTPIGVLLALVFRRARVGLRLVAGERVTLLAASVLWWSVIEFAFLSVLGAVLRAKTHHHGLAGATFALLALVSGVGVALLVARFARTLASRSTSLHRVVLWTGLLSAFFSLAAVASRAGSATELPTGKMLVDVLAVAITAAMASSPLFARARGFAIVGVPVAAGVLFFGLSLLRIEPDLRDAFAAKAPLHGCLADTILPPSR